MDNQGKIDEDAISEDSFEFDESHFIDPPPTAADSKGSTLASRRMSKAEIETALINMEMYTAKPGQKFIDKGREKWPQEIDSVLSLVAFAVDVANISRFPFVCFHNGRSAFLIPYFTFLIISAFPILYMELLLGQFVQQGCLSVWKISPIFKGVGYCIEMILVFVMMYYNTVIAWSFVFISESFNGTLPWTKCDNSWNTPNCIIPTEDAYNAAEKDTVHNKTTAGREYFRRRVLRIFTSPYEDSTETGFNKSFGFNSEFGMGSPNVDLSAWMLLVFFLLFIVLFFGINLSRRIVWFTATLPYVILAILFFRGLTLPGATAGINAILTPDFSALLSIQPWVAGAIQIFYSSGAGFCVHLTNASHNRFHHNVFRDTIIVLVVNAFTSLFSALVVFAYLGNIAEIQHKSFANDSQDIVTSGPDLMFETYPDCIGKLSGSTFFAVIFFFMIIFIGFDTAIGGVQAITKGFLDELKKWFPDHRNSEQIFNFAIISFCFVINLLCCTRGGMWMYIFMDAYAAGVSLVFAILCQTVVVSWVWGLEDLCDAAEAMTGRRPGLYLRLCWKFLAPMSLLIVLVFSWLGLDERGVLFYDDQDAPDSSYTAGKVMSILPVLCIPFYIVYDLCHFPAQNMTEKVRLLLCPENEHAVIKANKSAGHRLTLGHFLYFGGVSCKKSQKVPQPLQRGKSISNSIDDFPKINITRHHTPHHSDKPPAQDQSTLLTLHNEVHKEVPFSPVSSVASSITFPLPVLTKNNEVEGAKQHDKNKSKKEDPLPTSTLLIPPAQKVAQKRKSTELISAPLKKLSRVSNKSNSSLSSTISKVSKGKKIKTSQKVKTHKKN